MKRVRVKWHTTEVTDYETVFEVPDEFDPNDIPSEPDFWDGDCPELVAFEDAEYEEHGLRFDEFTREADVVEVLGS